MTSDVSIWMGVLNRWVETHGWFNYLISANSAGVLLFGSCYETKVPSCLCSIRLEVRWMINEALQIMMMKEKAFCIP